MLGGGHLIIVRKDKIDLGIRQGYFITLSPDDVTMPMPKVNSFSFLDCYVDNNKLELSFKKNL